MRLGPFLMSALKALGFVAAGMMVAFTFYLLLSLIFVSLIVFSACFGAAWAVQTYTLYHWDDPDWATRNGLVGENRRQNLERFRKL